MTNDIQKEIEQLISNTKSELNFERATGILKSALEKASSWRRDTGMAEAYLLESEILAEQALVGQTTKDHLSHWSEAISILVNGWKRISAPCLASELAARVVDFVQDPYSGLQATEAQSKLRQAIGIADQACDLSKGTPMFAELLSRKSAILRHRAICQLAKELARNDVSEALRCAERACEEKPLIPAALLERGLAEWANARYAHSDLEYADMLRDADSSLKDSQSLGLSEVASLARARFYRLTYQPIAACEVFEDCCSKAQNRRRILRESPIYAESVLQLWYAGYPNDLIMPRLENVISFLENALSAGYRNARIVVDLAFARATLEGPEVAETTLSELRPSAQGIPWQRAIEFVCQPNFVDLPTLGFALGIQNGIVLTRLGTFAKDFMKDTELAGALYRQAERLSPNDPVVLTNLARFLLDMDSSKDNVEVERLLQRAASFADRRFTWWRVLRNRSHVLQGHPPPAIQRIGSPESYSGVRSISERQKKFQAIEACSDDARRGLSFERFMNELASISFLDYFPSYIVRTPGTRRDRRQIDNAFYCSRGHAYLAEYRWEKQQVNYDPVIKLYGRLRAVGAETAGIVVSMSGFNEGAVAEAEKYKQERCILLIDGDEVRSIINGEVHFDEMIHIKKQYYDVKGEIYHKWHPVKELAIALA